MFWDGRWRGLGVEGLAISLLGMSFVSGMGWDGKVKHRRAVWSVVSKKNSLAVWAIKLFLHDVLQFIHHYIGF